MQGFSAPTKLSRRHVLGISLIAAAAPLIAACAPSAPASPTSAPPAAAPTTAAPPTAAAPTSAPPTAAPPAPTAAPTSAPAAPTVAATAAPTTAPTAAAAGQKKAANQVLRFGGSIQILAGFYPAGFASMERVMLSNVFLPPLVRDKDHKLYPGLLVSYEANKDATEWILKVDPKAKWSDGSKITAQDVKAGWEANNAKIPEGVQLIKYYQFMLGLQKMQGQKEHRDGTAKEITGLSVVDPQTLNVKMTGPDPNFPAKLALPSMGIMKADQWAQDPFIFEKPDQCLYNGPYKPTKYDKQGQSFVFEPNPNWWGDPVTVKRVEVQTKVEESTLYALWQNNQIDAGFWVGQVLNQLFGGPDKGLIRQLPYGGIGWGIFFNVTKSPVDDINLRKAMLHSFDYIGILKAVFGDVQRPSIGIMSAELPCWKQRDYTYKYDVAMAKDFLAQSRYGTAQNVPKMQLATQFVDQAFPEFQAIIEQWRTNLGLRVELVKDKGYGVPNPEQQYDMTIWSIGAIIPDPVTFLTNALLFKDGTNWTKSHFENADIRSLLQQAGNLFPDDPKRCDLVQQAEQIFLDNYAGMGVERVTYEYWVKPWVTGWQNNVDLSPYTLPQIYIAEH